MPEQDKWEPVRDEPDTRPSPNRPPGLQVDISDLLPIAERGTEDDADPPRDA